MSSHQPDRDAQPWHILTCEYPPQVGGVSDYTFAIASSLSANRATHVWCPGCTEATPAGGEGVVVHRDFGTFGPADLRRVGRRLNGWPSPRRLFVQWVPQGFGYRSVNLGFALWLAWRAWIKRDCLHVMVHEPYLRVSLRPRRLAAAILQRCMLAAVASGAACVWLSTETWRSFVRPYVRPGTPIRWLPVPVATRTPAETRALPRREAGTWTVGHFGTYSPLITPLLTAALDVVLREATVDVQLIGRGSEEFRRRFLGGRPELGDRVRATGVVPPDDLAKTLCGCDVMMQPYPDGVTTRRTSTLALMALGCAVVTNGGELSEAFWSGSGAVKMVSTPDGSEIGRAAASLLRNAAERSTLSARALDLYDRQFHPRHAVAALEGAA